MSFDICSAAASVSVATANFLRERLNVLYFDFCLNSNNCRNIS